ncbi:MAG: DUF2808 domain-containing protein [Cyanobacteria bacterium P01_A01_bin.17]
MAVKARIFGSLVVGLAAFVPSATQAVQLADGTVHFVAVPRLLQTRTTNKDAGDFGATYYFTLSVPDDAGEPLQRVLFEQREGLNRVKFLPQRTRAFADQRRRQPVIPSDVQVDEQGRVSVWFDPPIAPGETLVVGLRPRRNPYTDGVYLFGVTAFPAGEKSQGQFLGFGRLHFYDNFRFHSAW